ncbi:F-box/kelch-repeat protein At3g06240 [Lactuca sativa]|uniref:F-box/kelch-repeat protein At3g06240 n=1 Tax=Lactuca sativa TaxID=4236 RepID=UPI001C68C1EE|nr:F-box/kelch-repeat protein At3g06240 [Lactuca sativa]
MKRHKHGDERDNFHASVVSSRVLEEEIAQDSKFISNNGTCLPNPTTSTASPQQPATMENLPHELLSNIFIRLFAKQLAQMRSVSKSWNAFLSHPSFVKSHLHHSIHNNDQILLIFQDEEFYSDTKPFTAIPSRSPRLELTNFIKFPVKPQSGHTDGIRVIGSVNGLICSSYDNHSVIHIWNPSLSALLTLPPYSTPCHGYNSFKIHFRFGFDPKTNDYKVVKLTGINGPYENVVTWWLQVEIYSMRKGSWKLITEMFPSHIAILINRDDVCADGHHGHLHWLGCTDGKEDTKTIVGFDLGSETFREIPLPDSTLDHNRSNVVGILAGKLCVMSYIEDVAYAVWVMDEYGVAESWVKHHVFSHFIGYTYPFGFTSHREFLTEGDSYLVLLDPSTNEQK